MKHFLPFFVLLICGPSLCAALKPEAKFSARDSTKGDSNVDSKLTVELRIRDESGGLAEYAIVAGSSAALDAANWTLEWTGGGDSASLRPADIRRSPSSGNALSELSAAVPDTGSAEITKVSWRLKIKASGGKPALTLIDANGKRQTFETLDLPMEPAKERLVKFIDAFKPIEPKFSVEGGDDGALFGVAFAYKSRFSINDRNGVFGWHADFEGSFTPEPEDTLTLYGRFSGNAGMLWGVAVPKNSVVSGSLLLDVNTRFESDQKADNYNYTAGAGLWGFVNVKPLEALSGGLRRILNPGGKIEDTASVLTLFTGYDYILDSEREGGAAAHGDDRLRFRARYRVPLRDKLSLPLVRTEFQVDGIADFSAVYDIDEGKFLPEWKASLEFSPFGKGNEKLAFVLSYEDGRISPTFADESAFLAGLRWKW